VSAVAEPAAAIEPVLSAKGISVEFPSEQGDPLVAARNIELAVAPGETLGLVGESGCGKSVTLRALCGLVPAPGRCTGGTVTCEGIAHRADGDLRGLRGAEIAMIFQDPATYLNPVQTIGRQITEVLRVKRGRSRRAARSEAIELLGHVGIPEPAKRFAVYPHELSGGMRQRVMIAIAIACRPRVLLADEPTTALDVTTQEQILQLLSGLQREFQMAIILVTHDLGVVEEVCDRVAVMYAGSIVERAETTTLVGAPRHPYTRALLAAMPHIEGGELPTPIEGQPPHLANLEPGCPFAPRCHFSRAACAELEMETATLSDCACIFAEEIAEAGS
jgi:peptide/nickel transport system ATP-binding protein